MTTDDQLRTRYLHAVDRLTAARTQHAALKAATKHAQEEMQRAQAALEQLLGSGADDADYAQMPFPEEAGAEATDDAMPEGETPAPAPRTRPRRQPALPAGAPTVEEYVP